MRTLQVINVKWYNATAWYAIYLAYTLKKLGHPSAIVTIAGSQAIPHAKKLGLDVYEMPLNSHKLGDILECNKKINELCQDFKPDIVNCHRGEAFFLWALKKMKFAYRLVRTRGDQRLPSTDFLNRYLHNRCSDAVIATNTKMTRYFLAKMKTPIKKLYTILGGVDTEYFYPDLEKRKMAREEFHFTEDDVVIGLVGRFDPVKGFTQCLEAFAGLFKNTHYCQTLTQKNTKKLHLVIAGRPCYQKTADFKKMVQDFQIPHAYVHFIENPLDVHKYMNMFDLGLIASISSEAIARVAFEMIACNVPLISSDVGVMPDIVPHDYMYESLDLHALTELFLKARDDMWRKKCFAILQKRIFPDRLDNDSEQNNFVQNYLQEKAFDIYGWSLDAFAQKTLKVYENCLTIHK